MSSKRMAISALLSNDASNSPQPSSPAPAPAEDEPPLKRQRQHHSYTQQYYDSYNAYPYSPRPSSSPSARYHPQSQPQHQSQSPRGPSPRHPWPPQHIPTPHAQPLPHPQWDDGLRYISPSSVTTPAAFDVPQHHRHSSELRGLGDDSVNAPRDHRFHPSSMGKAQSIAGVLTDKMRAPQTHTALPVPPQLRRDAQHSHITYAPSTVMDSQSPPARTRDISPLAVKISTPRTTPPDLSPRSSYTPQYISPTASYTTQSASPTPYSPHNSMHSRQNPPITYTSGTKISPTTAYPPSQHSPRSQYASSASPSTSQAPHFSRVSPSTSHPSASGSPTASYTPPSFRHPSCPPGSRDPGLSPVSERPRSPPAPVPPDPVPPSRTLSDPAPPIRTPPGADPSAIVLPVGAAAPSVAVPSAFVPAASTQSIPAPPALPSSAPPPFVPPSARPLAAPSPVPALSVPIPSASVPAPPAPSPLAPMSLTPVPSVPPPMPPPMPPPIMQQPASQVPPLKLSPADVSQVPPLKLSPIDAKRVNEERSFEEELLSLVDGEDRKPRPVPQSTPTEPPSASTGRKSSNLSSKPAAKSKQPPKPRAPAKSSKAKAAAKQASGTPASMLPPSPPSAKQQPAVARAKGKATATKKKGAAASAARSRSLSLKPAELTPTPAPEAEMTRDDDRLYCVCKTSYDEEKIMIACDRCDEWYHPACVGMPEVEVDLVDQYICKQCGTQNVGVQTTYKRRCYRGLKYIASHDTLPTCWKPARGAFSKYCSDDCGMAHMRAKILQSGRDAAGLWPAVKNARRREGVTVANGPVKVEEPGENMDVDMERKKAAIAEARKALKEADERELAELLRRLDEIMSAREACKAALECVIMRRRLLDLAVDRAAGRYCGWDVRLEMNDEELIGWATTEAGRRVLDNKEGENEEQCWCQGPEKCPRHNGWQNIRDMDVQGEVDSKNSSIKQLTDRERELRRRIEDINPPSAPTRQQHGRSGGKKKNQGKKSTRS